MAQRVLQYFVVIVVCYVVVQVSLSVHVPCLQVSGGTLGLLHTYLCHSDHPPGYCLVAGWLGGGVGGG